MDVILLGADMPRTLYWNNDVPPRAHIMRSLGGPVYSGIGLLIGVGWLLLTPPETALRYLGEIWTVASGFIFLAVFAPIPIVDGGVILKWALVLGGRSEAQADELVRRIGLGLGVGFLAAAVLFLLITNWLLAGILLVIGLVVFGAALKIIR
jgi:hypothetical protein